MHVVTQEIEHSAFPPLSLAVLHLEDCLILSSHLGCIWVVIVFSTFGYLNASNTSKMINNLNVLLVMKSLSSSNSFVTEGELC